jgi:1-acyl-sn-glycerol-3-phosphate acyltransferase
MAGWIRDLFESIRIPNSKQVFFRSLKSNRRLILWYASKLVDSQSKIDSPERMAEINELRKSGRSLTFISNHLTYADSHIIETLLIRFGFRDLASHLIHIAGQKTFEQPRRWFTRSLNTIRVYQPKARIEKSFKKKMNSRALKWAGHLKRKGYSLLVFPEGTRTRKHKSFNRGAANPKTTIYFRGSFVVPIGLMGAENIMPVGKILQNSAPVLLRVGDPVDHEKLHIQMQIENSALNEMDLRKKMMDFYMGQIDSLLDPSYRSKMPETGVAG